jgi:hypothetical protein
MAPCTNEGAFCSSGCTNACSFCTAFRCTGGQWMRMEAHPAPCFSCGPELRCRMHSQFCLTVVGGPAGSTPTYSCGEVPGSCPLAPTCACLDAVGQAGTCAEPTPGQVTITLAAP